MATITTTIREPKTFQQIQDQQNELGKNQTLESLNNNISKLIKAITDRDEKRETEQDRQLKMNQLELSKLQLRRAQLGLAKDEKYYSDYSRKWSEKNNFGTSIGLDKNTSGNIGAIGVSALTAGALNPVIVKNLLFPIMTPLMNVTKALATFPGILPILFRRASGKSSSAIESDPDRKLHGKLDQILGAIKDKARGNKKEKEEQEGLLSKLLKMLVLGAAGLSLVGAALGGEEGLVKNTLIEHGKAMLAGFVLGGWKGALVGLALDVFAKTTGIIPKETDKPTIIDVAADNARQKIEEWANIKISDTEFKLAVAGMMIAGPKGMLAGYILGNEKVQEAIRAFRTDGFEGLKDLADRTILKMTKDTPLEGIPVDVIEGAIAGAAAGSTFGIKGFVSGAILGAAGGFAWDRYKNATIPEASGINTNFDFSKGDFVISGTDKTYSDFLEPLLLEEIKDKDGNTKLKYTRQQAEKLAIERIKQYLEENKIDNKKQTITETIWNTVKENPIETMAASGGIALLTTSVAEKLLSNSVRSLAASAKKAISPMIDGGRLASIIHGAILLWIAKGLLDSNNAVNEDHDKKVLEIENRDKQASEVLSQMSLQYLKEGSPGKAAMAAVQAIAAKVTDLWNNAGLQEKLEKSADENRKDYEEYDEERYEKEGNLALLFKKTEWARLATINELLLLQERNRNLTNINEPWFGKNTYALRYSNLAEAYGLSEAFIKRTNELLAKDELTEQEGKELFEASKFVHNINEKHKIINKENEERIKEGKQKKEQEDAQDKALRQASEQANIEMNEREKNKKESDKQQIIITNESTDTTCSSSDTNGNKPWG